MGNGGIAWKLLHLCNWININLFGFELGDHTANTILLKLKLLDIYTASTVSVELSVTVYSLPQQRKTPFNLE